MSDLEVTEAGAVDDSFARVDTNGAYCSGDILPPADVRGPPMFEYWHTHVLVPCWSFTHTRPARAFGGVRSTLAQCTAGP